MGHPGNAESWSTLVRMAVAYFLKHTRTSEQSKPINVVIEELAAAKSRAGRQTKYIDTLKRDWLRFAKDLGMPLIDEVSSDDVQEWLE